MDNNNSNTPWSTALENIAKFANLLKSYALKWYDMYFNPTPKDVEVDKIADDSDELTTVTVPNLAKIKQTFDTWKGTVQMNIDGLQRTLARWNSIFVHSTASTGSITSSDGYDKVTNYVYDLSEANASSPSTSIVTGTSVTTISTPISLSGFYPVLAGTPDLLEILGFDELVNLNFAKIEGNIVFVDSNTSKRYWLNTEFDHDANNVKAVSNLTAGYNELHPEYSTLQILVAEKNNLSRVWIKPLGGTARTTNSGLHMIS